MIITDIYVRITLGVEIMKKYLKSFACAIAFIVTFAANATAADIRISSENELRAAFSGSGGTYSLSENIENISAPLVVSGGEHTLELNGFSVNGTVNSSAIIYVTGGKLTISAANSENGKIENRSLAAIAANGGELVISDGKFYGEHAGLIINGNAAVTINGGEFKGKNFGMSLTAVPASISVSGGSFIGTDAQNGIGLCVSSGKDGCYRPVNLLAENRAFDKMKFFAALSGENVYWCTAAQVSVVPTAFDGKSEITDIICKNSAVSGKTAQNVTLNEAIKTAAAIHSAYNNNGYQFQNNTEDRYDTYINYAINNKIIAPQIFDNYTRNAKRNEIAYIFANVLPGSNFAAINSVRSLPDIDSRSEYSSHIFLLCNAGVMFGNDSIGTFAPNDEITENEFAAIVSRVVSPNMRKGLSYGSDFDKSTVSSQNEPAECQKAENAEAAYLIYRNGLNSLNKTISMKITPELYEDVSAKISEWSGDCIKSGAYSYNTATGELKISVEYDLFFEESVVCKNPELLKNASAEAAAYFEKISALVANTITDSMTTREKLKVLHDYMTANYSYDTSYGKNYTEGESYSFRGLLNNKTGVCQAYAELFHLLATRAGIECQTVRGSANNPGQAYRSHMWNSTVIDGQTLYIDVTYDDPVPDTGSGRSDYFLISADKLKQDHIW